MITKEFLMSRGWEEKPFIADAVLMTKHESEILLYLNEVDLEDMGIIPQGHIRYKYTNGNVSTIYAGPCKDEDTFFNIEYLLTD